MSWNFEERKVKEKLGAEGKRSLEQGKCMEIRMRNERERRGREETQAASIHSLFTFPFPFTLTSHSQYDHHNNLF